MYDVNDRLRYKFKKYPLVSLIHDPLGEFSQISSKVLHIVDVERYIHSKSERIQDEDIHKDLGVMCNNDLTLKSKYTHVNKLN